MAKPSNHRGVQIWRQPQLRILVFNPPIEKVVLIEEDQLGKLANKSPRPGFLAPSPLNLMVFTTLKIAMYSNVLSFYHTNLPSPKALPGSMSMLPGFFVSPPGDAASILYTELVQANSRSKPGRVPGYRYRTWWQGFGGIHQEQGNGINMNQPFCWLHVDTTG